MNNLLSKTLLFFIIGAILVPSLVYASQGIEITPDPIFRNIENFIPGRSVTSEFNIKNNSSKDYSDITVSAELNEETKNLSSALLLKSGEQSEYLSNLLNNGQMKISGRGIKAETSKDFSLTMIFDKKGEDKYQNAHIDFDLIFKFVGPENKDEEEVSGVGGGTLLPEGLIIKQETEEEVNQESVTISWHTNKESTSRVIYSKESSNPELDLTDIEDDPSMYGYDFSTDENSGKTTYHEMTLTNLEPGTTYYYRCISHASPPTIGKRQSFTTSKITTTKSEQDNLNQQNQKSTNQQNQELVTEENPDSEEVEQEQNNQTEEKNQESKEENETLSTNNLAAALSSLVNLSKRQLYKILFILFILLVIYTIYRLFKEQRKRV